jgi:hypothetical protein
MGISVQATRHFASVITNENGQALPVFSLCLGVIVGDQISDQEWMSASEG